MKCTVLFAFLCVVLLASPSLAELQKEEPAKDDTTKLASIPATRVQKHPSAGDVEISNNEHGNNIAIRNTNTVILNGGLPVQPQSMPAATTPVSATVAPTLNGKEDLKEAADEERAKRSAVEKADEEKKKKSEIALDAKFTPFGGDYEDPSFYIFKSTVCFVRGLVRGSEGLIGTLPAPCRPKARLVFTSMKTNKPARVDVLADGRVYTITSGGGDGWLSLNGISFSIDTNPEITLVSGWQNYGGDYRPVSLTKESGLCMLSGLIKGTNWGTLGRVDADCTPDAPLIFSANNHDGITRIDVQSNGYFNFAGGSANNGWVSLDGLVWTKTGGMPLSLLNNWINYGGWRGAKYERLGDLCVLTGLIRNNGEWTSLISTLPAECRPTKRLTFGGNVHISSARVDILPDGALVYVTGKANWEWLSLSGIHFTVA